MPARLQRPTVIAVAVYAVALAFWFWPLFAHFNSTVLTGPGDGTLAIRTYEAAAHSGKNILSSPRDLGIGAPEGEANDAALSAATPLQAEFVTVLGRLVGWVAAWNLFVVLAFAVSSLGMFALVRSFGVSLIPSLLAGYVYAFNPWQFEKALEGHAMLEQTWVLPLLVWMLVRLRDRPSYLRALLVGAAIALAFYVSAYYLLFAAVVAAVFAIVSLWSRPRRPPLVAWVIAAVAAAGLVAPFGLYAAVTTDVSTVGRPTQDLQRFGADVIEYVVPSFRHPVFGHAISKIFAANDTRHFAEPTLYFGLTTIALALFGIVVALRGSDARRRFLAIFAALLVVVGFVMSLPREFTILSVTFPAPSWAIGHLTTLWRVYARFAAVVGLGLVLLAAFGADALQLRTRKPWLTVAIGAVAAFELAVTIPLPTWRTSPPQYVRWLEAAPHGIVAEYPAFRYGAADVAMQAAAYFWQAAHHQPLFSEFGDAYRTSLAARVTHAAAANISTGGATRVLAAEDVRYVVLHDDVYRADGLAPPRLPPGLTLVWKGGGVRIARVGAMSGDVQAIVNAHLATITQTLGALDPPTSLTGGVTPDGGEWQRATGDIQLSLDNPNSGDDWRYELKLRIRDAHPRIELVRGGSVVAAAPAGQGGAVSLGPFKLPFGIHRLTIRTVPDGAASSQPVVVAFDPRTIVEVDPSVLARLPRGARR